eukprot:4821092-Alexandrium_andersonii.AAC.1
MAGTNCHRGPLRRPYSGPPWFRNAGGRQQRRGMRFARLARGDSGDGEMAMAVVAMVAMAAMG